MRIERNLKKTAELDAIKPIEAESMEISGDEARVRLSANGSYNISKNVFEELAEKGVYELFVEFPDRLVQVSLAWDPSGHLAGFISSIGGWWGFGHSDDGPEYVGMSVPEFADFGSGLDIIVQGHSVTLGLDNTEI